VIISSVELCYEQSSVLGSLFESKLVAVSALSFAAVGGLEGEGGIALSAYFFVAVEFFCDGCNGGIHHTSSQSQHEVQGGLLLDVVIGKAAAVLIEG
jgi:hypothetical protein